jgi:hypothetical protein
MVMKWIYCLDKDTAESFEKTGFKKIGTSLINGQEATIFENSKSLELSSLQKYGNVMWSNKLML